MMGNPSSDIFLEQNIYWQILRKQLTFVGTWNSSYESGGRSEWTEALGAIESKRINLHDLITQRFSQDKLIEGLQLMKNHTTSYCKVMTIWNGD